MNLRDIRELETWDRFFDYLINTYYYRFRQQCKKKIINNVQVINSLKQLIKKIIDQKD